MSYELVTLVAGIGIGFAGNEYRCWRARRGRSNDRWVRLLAAVERCREGAEAYLRNGVAPPLDPLPVTTLEEELAALKSTDRLRDDYARVLLLFAAEAGLFNRGVDYAHWFGERHKTDLLSQELARARVNAARLVPGRGGAPTLYDEARAIVARNFD